jgi:uncharacterized membrane protein YqjE
MLRIAAFSLVTLTIVVMADPRLAATVAGFLLLVSALAVCTARTRTSLPDFPYMELARQVPAARRERPRPRALNPACAGPRNPR